MSRRTGSAASHCDKMRCFTLIELLIVVAILAILMAMLIPALGKAREMGKRAACTGNQRQIYLSLSMYVESCNDRAFLVYTDNYKQVNYVIHDGYYGKTTGSWSQLYQSGEITEPSIFYCPSHPLPKYQLNTADNPWPPGSVSGKYTRSSYGVRPEGRVRPSLDEWPEAEDFAEFADKAILSDVNGLEAYMGHDQQGSVATFGDGHSVWVPERQFRSELIQILGWGPSYSDEFYSLWLVLDEQ